MLAEERELVRISPAHDPHQGGHLMCGRRPDVISAGTCPRILRVRASPLHVASPGFHGGSDVRVWTRWRTSTMLDT